MRLASPDAVILGGQLGRAVDASHQGRLKRFIEDASSTPVALFSPEVVAENFSGDWNGEHVGKWMYAAARAAARSRDEELGARVRSVADYLVQCQESDGYLGTYSALAESRMTGPSNGDKTWDLWVHSYIILGLLEVNRFFPDDRYLRAARRVGDLCWDVLVRRGRSIADLGNHAGLSATVLLEPAVELHLATGEVRYLELADAIVDQVERDPALALVSRSLQGVDLQLMGDGKIYQLLWTFVGLAKLSSVTGRSDYLQSAEHAWRTVVDHHLTPGGGPWGGVATHLEVFNPKGYFNPYGMVETCSTMAWIHLNRELLRQTGEAKYGDELEKSIYNSLLGAQDPNGEDWAYFIFANGERSLAYDWACCKSSGALALEEIPPLVFSYRNGGIACNLYTESQGRLRTPAGDVTIIVKTDYPRSDEVRILVSPKRPSRFPLFLRIPGWAHDASVTIGREAGTRVAAGSYATVDRTWRHGDEVVLRLPMMPRVVRSALSVMHGEQEVNRVDYLSMVRGPVSYAAGLLAGYRREATIKIPQSNPEASFEACETPPDCDGPTFQLRLPEGEPIVFQPFSEAGGRAPGTWRASWISAVWE